MATTGGYARRQIKRLRRKLVRQFWWVLVLTVLCVIGLAVALAWVENLFNRWFDRGVVTAFILGAGCATAAAVVINLLGLDGARSYRDGLEAEAWTARSLNRLTKSGWSVFHDLEIHGGNIDHVLVGPLGAIAVETKLRNEEWKIDGTLLTTQHHRPVKEIGEMTHQAHRNARELRSLLFAGGVRTSVAPAIVLWGRGLTGNSFTIIDGVVVGLGSQLRGWIDRVDSTPLSDDQVARAVQTLERFQAGEGANWFRSRGDRTPDHRMGKRARDDEPTTVPVEHLDNKSAAG